MATRNTLYVVRVGEETPQGDGYTYLRWCNGEDYHWADHKDALRFQGRSRASALRRSWGKSRKRACILSPSPYN